MSENIIRIGPNKYIHVQDCNTNLTTLITGPFTFIRQDHELVVTGIESMISLPPNSYVRIDNPVIQKDGQPVLANFGEQYQVNWGSYEYRTADEYSEPFALYPGEAVNGKVSSEIVIEQNQAIRLIANRDFNDGKKDVIAGQDWLVVGPASFYPQVEYDTAEIIKAEVVKPNTALRLKAKRDTVDKQGNKRRTGEEWLIRQQGSYLPTADQQVVGHVKGTVLKETIGLHLRTEKNFTDVYGIKRRAGEEWLVTNENSELHILDIYEILVAQVKAVSLGSREYCVIQNPRAQTGEYQFGQQLLIKGEKTFFLQPRERMEDNTKKQIIVLGEEDVRLVEARENFTDDAGVKHIAGERWLVEGPREYIPPVEVIIKEQRKKIPLDKNEGIYVRNNRTGEVKDIRGETYLLQAHESLWNKQRVFPEQGNNTDQSRIVTYKAPHNTAVQLYDFKTRKTRVIFGPDLVMLAPDEQVTILNLSGDTPKREGVHQTIFLSLGPETMTDIVTVETMDHARLDLILRYDWFFDIDRNDSNKENHAKLFKVKDFIGIACKTIASRVRGAVSSITFDEFHDKSDEKIKDAVFGHRRQEGGRKELRFDAINLVVTNIDVQEQKITDPDTKQFLDENVHVTLEIGMRSKELKSQNEAEVTEEENKGNMYKKQIENEIASEESKVNLLKLKANSMSIELLGKARTEARTETETNLIRAQGNLKQAEKQVRMLEIESSAEIDELEENFKVSFEETKNRNEMEVKRVSELAKIEVDQFQQTVGAIGKDTILAISKAGPEMQAKLLKGLGLKGFLISDGKNPINLFNTANGMISNVPKNN